MLRNVLVSVVAAVAVFTVSAAPAGAAVSPSVSSGLVRMAEEEKLARDVYLTLGDMYSVRVFDSIARSEQRHLDSVRALLATYGVADPTAGLPVGQFASAEFQDLFDELVAEGSVSLASAAGVGVVIEELDIADLEDLLNAGVPTDVNRVYSNLLNGSYNHLRAFNRLA